MIIGINGNGMESLGIIQVCKESMLLQVFSVIHKPTFDLHKRSVVPSFSQLLFHRLHFAVAEDKHHRWVAYMVTEKYVPSEMHMTC